MAPRLDSNEIPTVFQELYRACGRIYDRFMSEFLAPLVSYLMSEACSVTGEIYSAMGGRYARVLSGITDGWISPAKQPPNPEDIEKHLAEIRDCSHYFIPDDAIADVNKTGDALDAIRGRINLA
jgi:hypothetical protein